MRMTVDSVLQYPSDIPSAQPRYPTGVRQRRHSNAGLPNLASRVTGQQNVPSRTTKISEKLVIIPSTDTGDGSSVAKNQEELEERLRQSQQLAEEAGIGIDWGGDTLRGDTWAERLGKAHRADKLSRVTAYCTAQSMRMRATADFIKKRHEARTKLYDDCLYVVYHTPLLPGNEGYRIRSRPVLLQPGSKKSILDLMIERGERHDHYESDLELYSTSPEAYPNGNMEPIRRPNSQDGDGPQINPQKHTITNPLIPHIEEYAEMFVFSYGVVVFWNFSERQERDILADLTFAEAEEERKSKLFKLDNPDEENQNDSHSQQSKPTETTPPKPKPLMTRPLSYEEVETEEFHFQYSDDVKAARVFNDMFTLKPKSDHMVKLTISHAVAQSTKLCYFEERMGETMEACQNVPRVLAKTGELKMTRTEVLRMMGRLYKNRVDINLSSNVLDVPNFFWDSEPLLQPLYMAIREYLEIDSRVENINAKSLVFLDLATMLSDSVADTKMSNITIIIIVLIIVSLFVTITETSMRFNILQRNKDRHKGEESDPLPGGDDMEQLFIGPAAATRGEAAKVKWMLEDMTLGERVRWVSNLTTDEKETVCGQDIICRTFAGV
ncbi:hypothetical protein MKZ38_000590 [Zalerion maritima]|uniref:DUF155 domain-containing protein n=1 Tax=Zalerion maritima TaxID=339359 RepID=A0AAD5RSR5_9PEZI|nr:hypothetical protein MKZ38_000590 [Zalerion maritima]